ncbi:fumarylacetoacetate hydrolase family protein [Pararobbsia silviterrae]|uniref:2-hydroxyhepta-2,4-diene-1,7-dioate isomerase n=1 Tax=Pararobbsia silviterrae TaxID=1792498 RepID=A0A494Y6G4_9BURK|nr:fumarylacetoacetate hydrolase family protein [Pararobbsia silviterrae]RKP57672.1 2-hydroxyhepta-2,4-diene-1,7-dioate isomerase [Pararobbsia silviterrae]
MNETQAGRVPIDGTVYGVALNARAELAAQADAFARPPYGKAPSAPVMFIKPRNTYLAHGGQVRVPATLREIEASAALAIVIGEDAYAVRAEHAMRHVAGVTLAIHLAESGADYFRPPIREHCRDGFLPIGPAVTPLTDRGLPDDLAIDLEVDARIVSSIRLDDAVWSVPHLIASISSFMTLRAGDALLCIGTLPASRVRVGSRVAATAPGVGRLECVVEHEGGRQ